MSNQSTRIHLGASARIDSLPFRTAVSLHRHTMHSEESMAPLPHYVRKIPVARRLFQVLEERYQAATRRPFDYDRAFWTPPLPAQAAHAVEREQIESSLGRAALVSLADHDNIEAGTQLQVLESMHGVPVSLEWTLPRGPSFLHLGVHNLPPSQAHQWVREFRGFTAEPSQAKLEPLLAGLHDSQGTLVVLNHPLWDEPGLGADAHFETVRSFLRRNGRWIHALEVNGLRPWQENNAILEMARELGYPAVSGGDSHGSAPNTVLNLTNAASFAEFVTEVRQDRVSEILRMPQYRGPHGLRYAECTLDIVREYPELAGRRRWMDRAFCREPDGSAVPLSAFLGKQRRGAGDWLLLSLTRLLHSGPLRATVRAALAAHQESPL